MPWIQNPVLRPNACVHSLVHNPDPLLGGAWWMMVSGGWNDLSTQGLWSKKLTFKQPTKQTNKQTHSQCVCPFVFVVQFFGMFHSYPRTNSCGPKWCFWWIFQLENQCHGDSHVPRILFLGFPSWVVQLKGSWTIYLYIYLLRRHLHDAMICWTYVWNKCMLPYIFFIQNICTLSWYLDF